MRAFGVVVFDVFPDKIFEVALAEHEEVIRAFPFYGSDKAFGIRVQIKPVAYELHPDRQHIALSGLKTPRKFSLF